MKKLYLLIFCMVSSVWAIGQEQSPLQFISQSFKEIKGELGSLSSQFAKDWPNDVNDEPTALVRVRLEQISEREARSTQFNILGSNAFCLPKYDFLKSHNEVYLFITATSDINLEAVLANGNRARFLVGNLKAKTVYEITLRNTKTATISIDSKPQGIDVLLDGRSVGKTPAQPANVAYGKHTLTFSKDGKIVGKEEIEVEDGNIRFDDYDFQARQQVYIESDPSGADIYVDDDKTPRGRSPLSLDLVHGLHNIIAVIDRDKSDTIARMVDETTTRVMLYPVKKKTIELYASYQGERVNAHLDVARLDGQYTVDPEVIKENKPSYRLSLPYGRYKFRMAYGDNYKERTVAVKQRGTSIYEFPIKAKNSIVWPWQREYESAPMGFSMGYVTKQWVTKGEGSKMKEDVWGREDKMLHGLQVGLHFQPCLSWGLGFYSGLFYECYLSWSDEMKSEGYLDHFVEHSLYLPVHAYYRIPFSRQVALSVHGGIGMDYGIHAEFSSSEDDNVEPVTDYYGQDAWPKRFNLSAEIGFGLRIKAVQVNALYSKGLTDHKFYTDQGNFKTVQNKLGLSVSWVFSAY